MSDSDGFQGPRFAPDKYTNWASGIEHEQLEVLFWACGELGIRCHPGMDGPSPPYTAAGPGGTARAEVAVRVIGRLVRGEKVTLLDYHRALLRLAYPSPR